MGQSAAFSRDTTRSASVGDRVRVAETIRIVEPRLVPLTPDIAEPAPRHLMVIPDGHRRWATLNGLTSAHAYVKGANVGIDFVREFLRSEQTSTLTFFLLAPHTFDRTEHDLEAIFVGLDRFLRRLSLLCLHGGCRILCFGHLEHLPDSARRTVTQLIRASAESSVSKTLNLLLYYSGTLTIDSPDAFRPADHVRLPAVNRVYRAAGCARLSDAPVLESLGANLHLAEELFPSLRLPAVRLAFSPWEADGRAVHASVSRLKIESLEK